MERNNTNMSLQKIPFLLSVVVLLIAGTAVAAFVHAQSGTTITKTFAGSAIFQSGDAGGSIENNTLLTQKVINLKNTGSHTDVFRTTLPINPEARCGLVGPNMSSPAANMLPNTLPITLDTSLAVNETTYISVACVTSRLPTGPFTWSYKTISYNFLAETGVEKVLAEVQDTVQVTQAFPCIDSDGGMNTSIKGIATGTEAGGSGWFGTIFGQEPYPHSAKATTDKFSTYIDHCSLFSVTQVNEGYCGADGMLHSTNISCANGCKEGVCVTPPASSSVSSLFLFSSSSAALSPRSASASTLSVSSLSTSAVPVLVPVGPAVSPPGLSNVPADFSPPLLMPSVTTPGVSPAMHPAPSPTLPKAPTKSPVQKTLSKSRVKVIKKQQQALRRELRSLERSLLRKKNHVALSQIADLRDELADLDLRDPSAVENLQSLQKEIADLRSAVAKKAKRGG